MGDSYRERLLFKDKKNDEMKYDTSIYDSSDYHPDQFGLGKFSGKVLEEIHEDHDQWENFMTTMFLIGIILIPLQLIFADIIKPYDIYIVKLIQEYCYSIITEDSYIYNFFIFTSSLNFSMSITVFYYLTFENGVAYKTALVGSFAAYFVFIFKLIIHDSRPFWLDSDIKYNSCKQSFGSPSLDLFIGMLYSHYMYFCTERALMSSDRFINQNRKALLISRYISISFIVINYLNGFFYLTLGVNFLYQILITYFYGFIVIRIVQVFNKEIDSYTNGTRFIESISNVFLMDIMFYVGILAIVASITYSIVCDDLIIPREWEINISAKCDVSNLNDKLSIKETFLESAVLFNILGATMGINLILKQLNNSKSWVASNWSSRLTRGFIGFSINVVLTVFVKVVKTKSIFNSYMLLILIYWFSGYTSYGLLPIAFYYCKMTNVSSADSKNNNYMRKILDDNENEKELLFQESNKYYDSEKDFKI